MTPSTRQDAVRLGSVFFATGKPCRNGHTAARYTSTGHCTECLRVQRSDTAVALRESRRPTDGSRRLFTYRLHPDDHAAALAFCQGLDTQRGLVPKSAQAVAAAEPPRSATPEEVAVHRARIMADLGATQRAQAEAGMSEAMAEQLRAYGFLK